MIGIYKITNLDNGKMYVGQAVDIKKRWREHTLALNKNQHDNRRLQNSWNVHGEDRYEFSVIEECDIDELDDLEIYWIDKLRTYVGFKDCNGYNESLGGQGWRRFTKDYVEPVCNLYNSGEFDTVPQLAAYLGWEPKKVRRHLVYGSIYGLCDYSPDGKMVEAHLVKVICLNNRKAFNSVNEAEKYYGIHGVASCCVGKHKYAGKDNDGNCLMWMHLDKYEKMTEEEIQEYIERLNNDILAMYVVCLNNLQVYENSQEAAKAVGLKSGFTIQSVCNGKSYYAGKDLVNDKKYVWAYYKDYINMTEEDINNKISKGQVLPYVKRVICLNNNKIFDTPKDAAKWALDVNAEKIKNCCRGTANSAGIDPDSNDLLTWMYYDDFLSSDEEYIKAKIDLTNYRWTNRERSKKIVCLNNMFVFNTLKDASIWCGMKNASNIGYNARKNKTSGKHPETGEKLTWMYYDDYIKEFDESTLIKYQSA